LNGHIKTNKVSSYCVSYMTLLTGSRSYLEPSSVIWWMVAKFQEASYNNMFLSCQQHEEVPADREVITHDRVLTSAAVLRIGTSVLVYSTVTLPAKRQFSSIFWIYIPFMHIVYSHHTVWYFKPWMLPANYKARYFRIIFRCIEENNNIIANKDTIQKKWLYYYDHHR